MLAEATDTLQRQLDTSAGEPTRRRWERYMKMAAQFGVSQWPASGPPYSTHGGLSSEARRMALARLRPGPDNTWYPF